jgi:hypothetical protein
MVTPSVAVNEYVPLELGYWWEYQSASYIEFWMVDRVMDMGRPYLVYAVTVAGNSPNAGLEYYWSNGTNARGDDGKVYGFHDTVKDSGLIYDPPVRFARKDMNPADHWEDDTDVYEMPGNVHLGRWRFEYVVEDTSTMSVPAGVYLASGVTVTVLRPGESEPRPFDPRGFPAGSLGGRSGKTWWSKDVGAIGLDVGDETVYMTRYDFENAVDQTSWGRLKSLFR